MNAILRGSQIIAGRIADTSWLLNVEHVGLIVPGVRVLSVVYVAVLEYVRARLLQKAEHGRAAWTAIKPNNCWSGCCFVHCFEEHVMDPFGRIFDVDVTRVHFEGQFLWPSWQ